MGLTKKQEIFCYEVIKQPTLSAAYRIAYNAENMKYDSVNTEASQLMKNPKIAKRVQELKKKMEKKQLYTLEESVKRDLNLIQRYESALDVLENKDADKTEIEAAERTIKHIGASGYNSAQERLSKQHGMFDKDNKQKANINISFLD